MGTFASKILEFVGSSGVQNTVKAVCAVAILAMGIMFIYPSERSKEAAKSALPWVVVGTALALGAVAIAGTLQTSFKPA